jgi:hypothetical protein
MNALRATRTGIFKDGNTLAKVFIYSEGNANKS